MLVMADLQLKYDPVLKIALYTINKASLIDLFKGSMNKQGIIITQLTRYLKLLARISRNIR